MTRDTLAVTLLFLGCAAITAVAIFAITWQMRLAGALYGG